MVMRTDFLNTYLLDFDITLFDTLPTFIYAMLRILDENGITYEKNIIKIITPHKVNGTTDYNNDYANKISYRLLHI